MKKTHGVQLRSISANNFEQCLKCSICTAYCPVAAVNTAYPGPKQAGPDGERYRLKSPKFYDQSLKLCLNCKRCEVACPEDVRVGDIIQQARMKYARPSFSLRNALLASTDFVGTLATPFAPLINPVLRWSVTKWGMHHLMGVDKHRQFPAYSRQTFESWYKKNAAASQQAFSKQVSYFHGCYVNYNYPQLGKDLIKLMNAVGYGVNLLEGERCCGVALMANGLYKQARRQARANLEALSKPAALGQSILTTGSTCTFTMRDEYAHVLEMDNAVARHHLSLATRFLFRLIDERKIQLAFKPDYKQRIAYHTACHMQKLGWSIYSIELLRMIPGVELTVFDQNCCGIAGTYGFKQENYAYSQKIGETLFQDIRRADPDCVATDCETCKWQIEMSTGYRVKNPISILAEAIDEEATRQLNS